MSANETTLETFTQEDCEALGREYYYKFAFLAEGPKESRSGVSSVALRMSNSHTVKRDITAS